MEKFLQKVCSDELQCSVAYLIGLNLVRLVVQINLFQQGYISVSADEFARGIRAARWVQTLNINVLGDVQGTWLPFEKYLNGLVLFVWPDEILAPRATVFVASCVLIVVLYFLANFLFGSQAVAIVSTLFISFQPWFVWMSGTPMLEMYYFALFFAGLLLSLIWLKDGRKDYWIFAGICFLLSSGFHVQSWTLINLVNLLTLPLLLKFLRRGSFSDVRRLIGFYFLSNGLIIVFGLIEFLYTGELFAFLARHTSYSKWYYDGYNVPVLEKLFYYPRLVIRNSNFVILVSLVISLVFLARAKDRTWKIFPLLLSLTGLLLNSVLNIFSGPPSAAPDRYSLFHIIILSLYVGYGLSCLLTLKLMSKPKLWVYPSRLVALLLFLYSVWWGVSRIADYPKGMSLDTIKVGQTVNAMLDENPGLYMVELRYWDFLGVQLASDHFDDIVYDRVQDNRDRNTPSIFLQDNANLCHSFLVFPNLRYVLLLDEALKSRAEQTSFLEHLQKEGRWTVYKVIPEASPANVGCD